MENSDPRISAELVGYIIRWMKDRHLEINDLLIAEGISPDSLNSRNQFIPLGVYNRFFERAAAHTGHLHLGLKMGRFDDPGSLSALGHLFMSAPSLIDALEYFSSNLHALQEGALNRISLSRSEVMIEYGILDDAIVHRRQDAEYSIAASENLVRLYSAGKILPREVYFEHSCVGSYDNYRAHFGCDIFFDQPTNALIYEREGFNLRGAARGGTLPDNIVDQLHALAAGRNKTDGISGKVRELIAAGMTSETDVADHLSMSISTLGRRLRLENQSFRGLLTDHRIVKAQRMLHATDRSIADIALASGYAESASFTRAFRKRTGLSPSQFRWSGPTARGPAL